MSMTQKHCKVLKTKFCKVSGHVSVYFCIPQNNRTTMAPTIDKEFLWIKDDDGSAVTGEGQIWPPREKKKWQAHVFLGKMENCCQKDLGKSIILKWGHFSFREKRKNRVLNVSLILFFFRLPHSEEAQILTCIHTCCLADILAFTHYTQLPPFSASGPCEPNTNSPHPHMNTQPTMTSFKDNHPFPSPVPDLVLWCTFGNISLKHTPRDHPDSAMVLNLCHN